MIVTFEYNIIEEVIRQYLCITAVFVSRENTVWIFTVNGTYEHTPTLKGFKTRNSDDLDFTSDCFRGQFLKKPYCRHYSRVLSPVDTCSDGNCGTRFCTFYCGQGKGNFFLVAGVEFQPFGFFTRHLYPPHMFVGLL